MKVCSQLERAQFENRTTDPSNPAPGMVYWNTTATEARYYNGTAWIAFGTSLSGTSNIADGAIMTAKLADLAVTAAKIAAGTITATQIANATITGAKMAAGTITATQIANQTITATQIANGTITGTQVASNINLPGNAVQENGLNVVVSNTNAATSLCIIRGWCNSLGTPGTGTAGEGYTMSRVGPGAYKIFFTVPFASQPVITVSAINNGGAILAVLVPTISASEQDVHTIDMSTLGLIDSDFMFTAIGPR